MFTAKKGVNFLAMLVAVAIIQSLFHPHGWVIVVLLILLSIHIGKVVDHFMPDEKNRKITSGANRESRVEPTFTAR